MASRVCWSCNINTHMTMMGAAHQSGTGEDGYMLVQAAYSCDQCGRWSVGFCVTDDDYTATSQIIADAEVIGWLPMYGTTKDFPDVPAHIAGPASEAHQCRSIDANRAAILLARAVIEATAKAKNIKERTLQDMIDKMAEQRIIRDDDAQAAHEARHLGNDMAHGDFAEVTTQDADDVLVIMDSVLLEVYQGPAKTRALRERRAARKAAEAADGRS